MGWGDKVEWPNVGCIPPKTETVVPNEVLLISNEGLKEWPVAPASQQEKTTIIYEGPNLFPEINHVRLRVNVKPTHDPYKNSNSHIYYECACGAILDPGTKSFAALNGKASEVGWKIRFGEIGYTPYCVKCGEGVE